MCWLLFAGAPPRFFCSIALLCFNVFRVSGAPLIRSPRRFHWPVDGTFVREDTVRGGLLTVNPIAVRTGVNIFTENERVVCEFTSKVRAWLGLGLGLGPRIFV